MKTQDVTLKTCRRRWMIGRSGERWSGISVLAARHDDDDDDMYIYIYILIGYQSCGSQTWPIKGHSFSQSTVASILLYGSTTWTLTKCMEKKLDSNYTRILWAILNKSWRLHPTKQHLYSHQQTITKTIQVRRTGPCCRNMDELKSEVLLWTPPCGRAKAGRPARTYIQQHRVDRGCDLENLPEAIHNKMGSGTGAAISVLMVQHDAEKKKKKYIYIYI